MKLSVALCTFNGEKYIIQQLDSILKQTHLPDEIVIVDDLSEDNTIFLAEEFLKKTEVKYCIFQNKERLGVAANFLKAMKLSLGDYIFCCDQDDIWKEDKIECFLKYIDSTHKQLYFSNGLLVNADGESLNCTLWESIHFNKTMLAKTSVFDLILKKCFVTGAAMVVSRDLVNSIDIVPDGWLHDGWFSFIAGMNDSIEAIDEITFYYRQHENNAIGTHNGNLFKSIEKWKGNIKKLPKMRTERYLRFISLKNSKVTEHNKKLEDCIKFWCDLDQMKNCSSLKNYLIIHKHMLNGNYSRFYTGLSGAFRDLLSIRKG